MRSDIQRTLTVDFCLCAGVFSAHFIVIIIFLNYKKNKSSAFDARDAHVLLIKIGKQHMSIVSQTEENTSKSFELIQISIFGLAISLFLPENQLTASNGHSNETKTQTSARKWETIKIKTKIKREFMQNSARPAFLSACRS